MQYILSNDLIERRFEISEYGIKCTSLKDLRNGMEFLRFPSGEFSLAVDDNTVSSYTSSKVRELDGNIENSGNIPQFREARQTDNSLEMDFTLGELSITICYKTYPGVCGYRKNLKIRNTGNKCLSLSCLQIDTTCAAPGAFGSCDFYAGNDDVKQSVCFTLEGSEDIIRCHNPELDAGWLAGSAVPGVLRFFLVYPHWQCVQSGFSRSSAPWKKYLEPGECFTAPDFIFSLYSGALEDQETAGDFCELVRRGLPEMKDREGIMFCTWLPFLKNINSKLTAELVKHAASLGFRSFVVDEGWFTNDDRAVDREKFPNGLEEVAEQVHRAGMRFGLWLNVGTDYGVPDMPQEYFALRADGKANRLGVDYTSAHNICCFGSSYRHMIAGLLHQLAEKYDVQYFKLDFSSVSSPYGYSSWGCHSQAHEFHRGWEDSFSAMYEGMSFLRDYMAEHHPGVTVDFSFESFGTERPNIAALELSELHHVSNLSARDPEFQTIERVRKNFYRWLGKLPPERILNGLLTLSGKNAAEYLLTSFTGAPLVAGDLRELDGRDKERIRCFAGAFNNAAETGKMTSFRILENTGSADGFMRFAADGHGIACFFNREKTPHKVSFPAGFSFQNVETGETNSAVPAEDCAMFKVTKA